MRPTQAHVLKLNAKQAHCDEAESLEGLDEYEKLLRVLSRHKKQLKEIQSAQRKAEFKKSILPDYLPWIKGALEIGSGKQDHILMQWLVWTIDCNEYFLAVEIAKYAIFHDLTLPDGFSRTLGTLLAEEFADKEQTAKDTERPYLLVYLERIDTMTQALDMPDQSRARLYKAIGTISQEQGDNAKALEFYQKAYDLNPKIGVKGALRKLEKAQSNSTN